MPKVFLKISSLFVAVALCASFVCVPASAALALPGTTVSGSTGSGGSMLGDIEALAELTDLFDWLQDQEFEFVRMLKAKIDDDVCAFAPDKTSVHSFIRSYTLVDGVYGYHTICEYCSKSITELGSSAYSSYVSTLDSTTVSSSGTSSGDSSVPFDAVGVRVTHNGITLPPLPDVDFETYPYCLVRADSSSSQQYDVFYLQDEPKYFSMGQYIRGVTGLRYRIRYSDVATATEWSANGSLTNRNIGVASEWPIIWANVDIYDNSTGDLYLGGSASDSDTTVELPSADTRTSSLMQEINNYNIDNSYTDNSTVVNYYIGTVADDGSVSDIYNPGVYDEDTMVFTEPISGTQYQTTGWSYDYTERAYLLDLESGTMTVNGTDVAQVGVVYGDESVLIGYLDSSGDILSIDEFAYVMVSQSACNINGHTYTVETTKEASCVAAGERTYTCSNCGNQYAEDIPAVEHVYEYGVDREATCTTDGIILYTCTGCGTQYTESIPATGSHSYSYSIQTPATCTTPGVGLYECIYCGTSYTEEIPSGNGHEYEYAVSQDPTCTAAGTGLYTCSKCGDQYTEEIPMVDHVYQIVSFMPDVYDEDGNLVTAAYSILECAYCGTQTMESESETPVVDEGWFKTMARAIKSFVADAITTMGLGITRVFSSFADLIGGIFDFLNSTVIGGAGDFFDSFSDGTITDFFQQENEDGSTSTTLPGEVASGLSVIPGFFNALPAELRGVLIFGISTLFLLAALMLIL